MLGQAPSTTVLTDLVTKANAGSTVQELADGLASNAKFTANYPVWLTAKEFTTKVVTSMFAGSTVAQADVDAAVDYISGAITAGTFTKTSAVVALTSYLASADGVANTTYGSAAQSYQNKVAVAEYYTIDSGLGGGTDAELAAAISGVTSAADAVANKKAAIVAEAIVAAAPDSEVFTLTTAADTLAKNTGGEGADQFFGSIGTNGGAAAGTTLNAGDMMDGKGGADTLFVAIAGTNTANVPTAALTLKNIETIDISNFQTADGGTDNNTLNMAQATGINLIKLSGSATSGDTFITNLGALTDAQMWDGSGELSMGYTAAAVVGTTDTQNLTLSAQVVSAASAAAIFTVAGVETLSITSVGASKNAIAIADAVTATITTINASGSAELKLTEAGINPADAVTIVNAADMTGKFAITTGAAARDMSITGGSGADTFTLGSSFTAADTIAGGDGADNMILVDTTLGHALFAKTTAVETMTAITDNTTITLGANVAPTTFNFTNGGTAAADTKQTLVLNALYTNDTAVLIDTDADVVTNTANVVLTVSGDDASFQAGTVTGGTKADTVNITSASQGGTAINMAGGTNRMLRVDAINIVDKGDATTGTKAKGADISITTGLYGSDLTVDASALDAGTLNAAGAIQNNDETLLFDASSMTAKTVNVTGGGGRDTITGGSRNDTIDGGDGRDSINGASGGVDNIKGGAGKDTINMAAALTSADTIDGGDGTDTLIVTNLSTAALANVSNIETLAFNGTATLAADLSFDTIDLSNGTLVDSLTLATGYTNATTVTMDANDTFIDGAKVATTVNITGAAAVNITAGTTTADLSDVLNIGADSGTVATSTITGVDKMNVLDRGDAATGVFAAGQDLTINLASYATKVEIDAKSLDVGTKNAAGAVQADYENLTITGAATAAITVHGGGGRDSITGGANNDVINGNGENDTITMNNTLTYQDSINGGDGTDTLTTGTAAITDVGFMNVTNMEKYTPGHTSGTASLGAYFAASGIATVAPGLTTSGLINAAGVTTALKVEGSAAINLNVTTGTSNDTIKMTTIADTLTNADSINGGLGVDTIQMFNYAAGTSEVDLFDVTNVESFVWTMADSFDNGVPGADAQVLNVLFNDATGLPDDGVNGVDSTFTVSAAIITDATDTVTVNAAAILDRDRLFNITGGAARDTLTGGGGNDTISGGGQADNITGGPGADNLSGGAGKDIFLYAVADADTAITGHSNQSGGDTITDFTTTSDVVRVSYTTAADATVDFTNKGAAADNANGMSLLSSVLGQYFYNTSLKSIVMDTDANGLLQAGDLAVNLGMETLGAADVQAFITTGAGAETVTTGGGNDSVTLTDTTDNKIDTITLGAGNDVVITSQGALNLSGISNNGKDVINGGTGTDTLSISGTGTTGSFQNDAGLSLVENIVFSSDSHTFDLSNQTEALEVTTANGTNVITLGGASVASGFTGGTGVDTLGTTQGQLGVMTTVAGGAGTDVLTITAATAALVDADFGRVTQMENLKLTGANSITLGSIADAALGSSDIVTTGNDTTTITSTMTATNVVATVLATTKVLTLAGTSNYAVTATGIVFDTVTTSGSGTVNVTTGNTNSNAITAIVNGTGATTITGGNSNDVITVTGLDAASGALTLNVGPVAVTAGAGASTIAASGSYIGGTINMGIGQDTINAGAAGDYIIVLANDGATAGHAHTTFVNTGARWTTAGTDDFIHIGQATAGSVGAIGNGDTTADNAETVAAAITQGAEVAVVTTDMAVSTAANAVANFLLVGSLAFNIAVNPAIAAQAKKILVGDDGADTFIFKFTAVGATNTSIEAAELKLIGIIDGLAATAHADIALIA
jgi:hypothetical protein